MIKNDRIPTRFIPAPSVRTLTPDFTSLQHFTSLPSMTLRLNSDVTATPIDFTSTPDLASTPDLVSASP
ncbi:hypothetical protein Pmani_017165 [Petrolisthes manimaculis]|uniref:Uncharacterized protein n=1 Tax=Petrolisthes manimaculis TaxID=1843537 RepID=A0AAE1PQ76_9EUCA|nr:hypothetical protein Pmani_017165 [Petrolisthes manimaculis]